jgi:diguanylate cyclase (GGDEF)-like protein
VRNRCASFERLDTEFRWSQRYGRSLTVAMVDVDHFKDLNDRYGHATGDSVLAT